jgi:hypothetical protein
MSVVFFVLWFDVVLGFYHSRHFDFVYGISFYKAQRASLRIKISIVVFIVF